MMVCAKFNTINTLAVCASGRVLMFPNFRDIKQVCVFAQGRWRRRQGGVVVQQEVQTWLCVISHKHVHIFWSCGQCVLALGKVA